MRVADTLRADLAHERAIRALADTARRLPTEQVERISAAILKGDTA